MDAAAESSSEPNANPKGITAQQHTIDFLNKEYELPQFLAKSRFYWLVAQRRR